MSGTISNGVRIPLATAGGNTYSYDAKAWPVHFDLSVPVPSLLEMEASLVTAY